MTAFDIYCISVAKWIVITSIISSIISFFVSLFAYLTWEDGCRKDRMLYKLFKYSAAAFCMFVLTALFVPNSQQLAAMHVLPKLAEGKDLSCIEENFSAAAVKWLEKQSRFNKEKTSNER